MTAVDKPVLTGKRLIEDAIPIDVVSRTSASEKVGGRIGHPASAAPVVGAGARSPHPGPRSTPRWCQRTDTSRNARRDGGVLRLALPLGRPGVGHPQGTRGSARRERRPCHRKWSTCSPAAGAIPLEAARLGCEVTANELNPVAHLIERMMLEYPQAYPGLGDDVRRWGKVWIDRAWDQLADLYPPIPSAADTARSDLDDLFGGSADTAERHSRTCGRAPFAVPTPR